MYVSPKPYLPVTPFGSLCEAFSFFPAAGVVQRPVCLFFLLRGNDASLSVGFPMVKVMGSFGVLS